MRSNLRLAPVTGVVVVSVALWAGCNCGGTPSGDDVDGGGDGSPAECADAAACEPLYGPAPCGAWECNAGQCEVVCPGCTDADLDGYGVEETAGACAGPDCDDADDQLGADGVRSCYGGPAGTEGVGTCRAGTETCTAGVLAPCVGEVAPSGEACNGEDDDCNGSDDDGLGSLACGLGACAATVPACTGGVVGTCTPLAAAANDTACNQVDDDCDGPIDEDCACVRVAGRIGDDAQAVIDSNATPFDTIQAAIAWAEATSTAPKHLCVAAGAACGSTRNYAESVVMADGISVYGGYEDTTFTRCATTVILPAVPEGVSFPSSVSSPTVLDGFRINRAAMSTTAAITVDGATGVILTSLEVSNLPVVSNSYGINLINGAAALIARSGIDAGTGTSESIAIRSVGSTPVIRENCQAIDPLDGHCTAFCGNTGDAIRGRFSPGTGLTYGVLLVDSPGAVVDQNAICGIDADQGSGIKIEGDAAGTLVHANLINAWAGAMDAHGIWMEDCGGAAPWILDNEYIAASGDTDQTRVDGIRAIGDCHPVIDSNDFITGGGEGGATGANGVYCGARGGSASQCVVLGNELIQGSEFGFPPTAVGVRCDDDGCARIADNVINGRAGEDVWGLYMGQTGTVVERNWITGGCGANTATGVYAVDSFATFESNVITAGVCFGALSTGIYHGVEVVAASGPNEVTFHSNTIDGGGITSSVAGCTGAGLALAARNATAPAGIYRSNIIVAGDCPRAINVEELSAEADPRIFETNNLDPQTGPVALYFDEASSPLTSAGEVDALNDMTVSGTLSVDSGFVAYPTDLHLDTGSACIDVGLAAGAPPTDVDGDLRDATPDLGGDEYIP